MAHRRFVLSALVVAATAIGVYCLRSGERVRGWVALSVALVLLVVSIRGAMRSTKRSS